MDLEIVHLLLTLNGTQAKCTQIQIQDQSGPIMFLKGNKSPNVEDLTRFFPLLWPQEGYCNQKIIFVSQMSWA